MGWPGAPMPPQRVAEGLLPHNPLLPEPGLPVRVWSQVRLDAVHLHCRHGLQHHLPHYRAVR